MNQFRKCRKVSLLMAFFAAITLFVQCKKDSGSENNPPVTPKNYLPVTAGSTFTYHSVINTSATDYTLTATSGDSLVNGKSYTKFTGSDGETRYYRRVGVNYYQVSSLPTLPGSPVFEDNYLNDSLPVNATWNVQFQFTNPLGFPAQLTAVGIYKIIEKGISLPVNGTTYKDVIHVRLTDVSGYAVLSDPPLVTGVATGDFYYSQGVGLVQGSLAVADNSSYGIAAYNKVESLKAYTVK